MNLDDGFEADASDRKDFMLEFRVNFQMRNGSRGKLFWLAENHVRVFLSY